MPHSRRETHPLGRRRHRGEPAAVVALASGLGGEVQEVGGWEVAGRVSDAARRSAAGPPYRRVRSFQFKNLN